MTITIHTLQEIHEAARQFVAAIGHHKVFAFYGTMGAGKTTFIKALCETMGVTDDVVASPTFAIVNEYEAQSGPVYHFDFYRIRRLSEAVDMGFDDYIYSGHLCLIEWPELVEPLLPDDAVKVSIEEQPDGTRLIKMDCP